MCCRKNNRRTTFDRGAHDRGFTLIELLVAMLVFGILVSLLFINISLFMNIGTSTNAAMTSQNNIQLAASAVENYLLPAVDACGYPPFIHAVNDPIMSSDVYDPVVFNAALGPDADSPPSAVAMYFKPDSIVGGVQTYSLIIMSAPIPPHCGAQPSVSPYYYNDSQVYYPVFVRQTSGGGDFYPLIDGVLGSTPVTDARELLDVGGIVANTDGNPWFEFCSPPGTLASPGRGYSVTGSNLADLPGGAGYVPPGNGLWSIKSVAFELEANSAPRSGGQVRATAAKVTNMLDLYNYNEYAPASPSMSSAACISYVKAG